MGELEKFQCFTLLPEALPGMYSLAHYYCDAKLQMLCEARMRSEASPENVTQFYLVASKYEVEEMKSVCLRYAADHLTDVVLTRDYSDLNGDVAKDFIIQVARYGV